MATERMVSRKRYSAYKDKMISRGRIKRLFAESLREHPDLLSQVVIRPPKQPPLVDLGKIENMLEVLDMRREGFMGREYAALIDLLSELHWRRENCHCDGLPIEEKKSAKGVAKVCIPKGGKPPKR